MSERRPRAVCPVCGRDTALTARTRVIGPHIDPAASTYRCAGVGHPPTTSRDLAQHVRLANLIVKLEDLIAHQQRHIEARARQLADERARQEACGA